jgi:hypothetical protein
MWRTAPLQNNPSSRPPRRDPQSRRSRLDHQRRGVTSSPHRRRWLWVPARRPGRRLRVLRTAPLHNGRRRPTRSGDPVRRGFSIPLQPPGRAKIKISKTTPCKERKPRPAALLPRRVRGGRGNRPHLISSHAKTPRGAKRPGDAWNLRTPSDQRAQGMPDARCIRKPRVRVVRS